MSVMSKAFPLEFRRDVVAVARKSEAPIGQIAKDFGISQSCLQRWLKLADIEDGTSPRDHGGVGRAAGGEETGPAVGAGERDPAPGRGLLRPRREPKMMYPLVLDLAADSIPVAVTCRVLGNTGQAFYKWRKNPVTQRDFDDAHLINAAVDVHADDPTFGYRFIADELAGQGIAAGENRVARLCSQEGIWSIHAKKRGLKPPVHDDHVKRVFTAAAPNLVWLTDITEHATSEGKLYLCADLGRLLQPDRRLLHRPTHEGLAGGVGVAERGRVAGT
jgi:hypothetical protein